MAITTSASSARTSGTAASERPRRRAPRGLLGLLLLAVLQHAVAAAGAPALASGMFEGLMLAVSPGGKLSGYFREEQGEGVVKRCTFFVAGQVSAGESAIVTWNDRRLPGTLAAQPDGVRIRIADGRDHPGCGLVLPPEIDTGIDLDRVSRAEWIELRSIAAPRAYFHAEPDPGRRLRAYVVKGDVIGILRARDGWLQAEFVSGEHTTRGWVRAEETGPIEPPAH